MTILLSIFSVISFIGVLITGFSLRKYQLKSYDLQIEQKKIKDDYEQRLHDDQQLLHEHQTQLTQLQNKISAFDSERDKIYRQAFKEGESQITEVQEKYLNEINQYKDQIDQLNFKYEEILAENDIIKSENNSLLNEVSEIKNNLESIEEKKLDSNFDPEKLVKKISEYQATQFKILDQPIDFKQLQFVIDGKIANNISIKQITSSLNLNNNPDIYIKYRSENNDKIDYVIISSGNNIAYLIDARFSDFLLEQKHVLNAPSEQLKSELKILFEKRISSINASDNKEKIIDILNESGDLLRIEKLYTCIYIPSGEYIDYLYQINPAFFEKAQQSEIFILNPAGLVNLIHFANSVLSSQNNIVSTQHLVDSLAEDFNLKKYQAEDNPVEENNEPLEDDDNVENLDDESNQDDISIDNSDIHADINQLEEDEEEDYGTSEIFKDSNNTNIIDSKINNLLNNNLDKDTKLDISDSSLGSILNDLDNNKDIPKDSDNNIKQNPLSKNTPNVEDNISDTDLIADESSLNSNSDNSSFNQSDIPKDSDNNIKQNPLSENTPNVEDNISDTDLIADESSLSSILNEKEDKDELSDNEKKNISIENDQQELEKKNPYDNNENTLGHVSNASQHVDKYDIGSFLDGNKSQTEENKANHDDHSLNADSSKDDSKLTDDESNNNKSDTKDFDIDSFLNS